MLRAMHNIFESSGPTPARFTGTTVFQIQGRCAGRLQGRAKVACVKQSVFSFPESAMNEDYYRMRSGSRRYSQITELERVFTVRYPGISFRRWQLQDVLR